MPERKRRLKGLIKRAFEFYDIGDLHNNGEFSPDQIVSKFFDSDGNKSKDETVARLILGSKLRLKVESTTVALRIAREWDEVHNSGVENAILNIVYPKDKNYEPGT